MVNPRQQTIRASSSTVGVATSSPRTAQREGLTFLELIAVMVIVGLISSGAFFSFRRSLQRSRLNAAFSEYRFADQQARQLAQRSGETVKTRFDSDSGRIARSSARGDVTLAASSWLTEVRPAHSNDSSSGILYFPTGTSNNVLVTRNDDQCCLILGATGQAIEFSSITDAKDFLHAAQTTTRPVTD